MSFSNGAGLLCPDSAISLPPRRFQSQLCAPGVGTFLPSLSPVQIEGSFFYLPFPGPPQIKSFPSRPHLRSCGIYPGYCIPHLRARSMETVSPKVFCHLNLLSPPLGVNRSFEFSSMTTLDPSALKLFFWTHNLLYFYSTLFGFFDLVSNSHVLSF